MEGREQVPDDDHSCLGSRDGYVEPTAVIDETNETSRFRPYQGYDDQVSLLSLCSVDGRDDDAIALLVEVPLQEFDLSSVGVRIMIFSFESASIKLRRWRTAST